MVMTLTSLTTISQLKSVRVFSTLPRVQSLPSSITVTGSSQIKFLSVPFLSSSSLFPISTSSFTPNSTFLFISSLQLLSQGISSLLILNKYISLSKLEQAKLLTMLLKQENLKKSQDFKLTLRLLFCLTIKGYLYFYIFQS